MWGLDHHPDEYLSEAKLSSLQHGGEGEKNPTQGLLAFVAMRQMTEGRQSTTTLPAQKQGNRAVTAATRYPEGGTSVNNWARAPHGTDRGGGEATPDKERNRQKPNSAQGGPHSHTNEQGHNRGICRLSTPRRRASSNIPRTNFRVAALPIHATRPMAPG